MTRFALLISTILMLPLATRERNLLHRCHCLVGILTNLLHGLLTIPHVFIYPNEHAHGRREDLQRRGRHFED